MSYLESERFHSLYTKSIQLIKLDREKQVWRTREKQVKQKVTSYAQITARSYYRLNREMLNQAGCIYMQLNRQQESILLNQVRMAM